MDERTKASSDRLRCARQVSPAEAIRALIVLGRHLEVVEADYPGAETVCQEALEIADEIGDVPAQIELHAAIGQLATYPAQWDGVEEHTAAAARLAEREGLSGQLCLPLVLQGILAWRVAEWEHSEEHLRHAYEIASSAGRSETAFSALLWLGACHRDRGDFAGASDVLTRAASICKKAGLVGQLVEAGAARAVALGLDGRKAEAREAAAGVEEQLAGLPPNPIAKAAAAEASGVAWADGAAAEYLRDAVEGWERAGRPLDAIRARLLLAPALGADAWGGSRNPPSCGLRGRPGRGTTPGCGGAIAAGPNLSDAVTEPSRTRRGRGRSQRRLCRARRRRELDEFPEPWEECRARVSAVIENGRETFVLGLEVSGRGKASRIETTLAAPRRSARRPARPVSPPPRQARRDRRRLRFATAPAAAALGR